MKSKVRPNIGPNQVQYVAKKQLGVNGHKYESLFIHISQEINSWQEFGKNKVQCWAKKPIGCQESSMN